MGFARFIGCPLLKSRSVLQRRGFIAPRGHAPGETRGVGRSKPRARRQARQGSCPGNGESCWPDVFINEVDFDLAVWYNRFNSLMCYLSKISDAHKKSPRGAAV